MLEIAEIAEMPWSSERVVDVDDEIKTRHQMNVTGSRQEKLRHVTWVKAWRISELTSHPAF